MRLVIASDHGGIHLKKALVELLVKEGHHVEDLGANGEESVDYPDYAHALAKALLGTPGDGKTFERGILVCGSGVGMSIAANRHAGIRAVVCSETYSAKMSRQHNDANVLCLGERVVGPGLAWDIVSVWLREETEQGRHAKRREKIEG